MSLSSPPADPILWRAWLKDGDGPKEQATTIEIGPFRTWYLASERACMFFKTDRGALVVKPADEPESIARTQIVRPDEAPPKRRRR